MKLEQAKLYAEKIVEWIAPYCLRTEIAGSIRRERPACNDIDIVRIPKLQLPPNDLLGVPDGVPMNLLNRFLRSYVEETKGETWFRSAAGVPGFKETFLSDDAVNVLMHLRKCDCDFFAANNATFTTRLVTRTGSKEHNIWISQRAQHLGGAFNPQLGIHLRGELIQPQTEEEFYTALDLPYIAPKDREIAHLRTIWNPPSHTH